MNLKIILTIFLLNLFCSVSLLHSENDEDPPLIITFHDLEQSAREGEISLKKFNGKPIQIRGFLYVTNDGQTVLASEPNLKSCCVGSAAKRGKQLLIKGNVTNEHSSDFAVTINGILEIHPNEHFFLHLKNASLAKGSTYKLSHLLLGSFLLVILGFCGIKYSRSERSGI